MWKCHSRHFRMHDVSAMSHRDRKYNVINCIKFRNETKQMHKLNYKVNHTFRLVKLFERKQIRKHILTAQSHFGCTLDNVVIVSHETLIHSAILFRHRCDFDMLLGQQTNTRSRSKWLAIFQPPYAGQWVSSSNAPLFVTKFRWMKTHTLVEMHDALTISADLPRSTVCWAGWIFAVNDSMTVNWISKLSLPSLFVAMQIYTPESLRLISLMFSVPPSRTNIRFNCPILLRCCCGWCTIRMSWL